MRFGLIFSMSLPLIASFGCKPQSQSELQSLDNYAAGKTINTNFCSASASELKPQKDRLLLSDRILFDAETAKDSAKMKDLRAQVVAALSAVPTNVQKMYLAMDGYVYVHAKTEELCGAKKSDNLDDHACFRFGRDPDGKRERVLDIYVQPTREAIRHNVVRQFGYVYTQFLARMTYKGVKNDIPRYEFQDEPQKLFNQKLAVASAFVADHASSVLD